MPTRRFVLTSALAAAAIRPELVLAAKEPQASTPTVLRLITRTIAVDGKSASVYGIRQPDDTEGITMHVGDRFRVRVENRIGKPSLIHWHGLAPPWRQDGVPGISGPPIAAGGSADYDFPLAFGGTFWMHSHQGLQEQLLLDAPLIIRDQRDKLGRQEIILRLNDFSFTPPDEIFANLKKGGGMPGMASNPVPAVGDGGMSGMAAGTKPANMNAMTSGKNGPTTASASGKTPDLNDVTYDAFLANDRTLADPEIVHVEPGSEVLLRVINAGSMTSFHFDLGVLNGRLIAVDGTFVVPLTGRRFPIAVAQRLDIVLKIPRATAAYPLLASVEGERNRTGILMQAGKAAIARIPLRAEVAAPAITMDLEKQLRAAEPLKPRKLDRIHNIDLTGEMSKYLVDQWCGLEPRGAAAAGCQRRAGRPGDDEFNRDAASDAPARPSFSGCPNRQPAVFGCGARYREGAAGNPGGRRL
jgi:FtsP/CotA-like multicopper oxidase with cupredoxin domain